MNKLPIAALAGLLLAGTSPVVKAATLLYSTGFSTPAYNDATLVGQDGWAITGTVVTNPITVANTATNGTISLATTGQDVNHPLGVSITSGSVYLKFDLTVSASSTGDYFIHLGDGGTSNFYARTYIKTTDAGFTMALGTGSGAATYGSTVLTLGTTYTILVRYDIVTGAANDTGALFVNPTTDTGDTDTAYVAATTTGTDAGTISTVNIRQGTASTAPTVTIDNISVLATVPEPGAALLGSIGLFGLLRRRRA